MRSLSSYALIASGVDHISTLKTRNPRKPELLLIPSAVLSNFQAGKFNHKAVAALVLLDPRLGPGHTTQSSIQVDTGSEREEHQSGTPGCG
jgi:hypothetical protein